VPDTPYRPIATLSWAVIFLCALFFLVFPLCIAPSFAAMFRDFGGQLPLITALVLEPKASLFAFFVLAAGVAIALIRPRERTIVLSLTAGGGVFLVIAYVACLYVPIFALSGQIK